MERTTNRRKPDFRIAAFRSRVSEVCVKASNFARFRIHALDHSGGYPSSSGGV